MSEIFHQKEHYIAYGVMICMIIFQKFSKCEIGQQLKHIDKTGREKLVVCTEKIKGVPQWKFVDGKQAFNMNKTILCTFQ